MGKVFKWIGIVFASLIGLLVLVIVVVLGYGQLSFKKSMPQRPVYAISANISPEGVERGQYLLESVMACAGACHSPQNGPPYSGTVDELSLGPATVLFAVPNLTSDVETGLGSWTDAEIARAIREGVGRDGRALEIMPAFNYHVMSDADIAAVIGYLRSLPPVSNEIPDFKANLFGKALLALNVIMPEPLGSPILSAQTTPPVGSLEYGAYLTSIAGCRDCHSVSLQGGQMPDGGMLTPDITAGGDLSTWSEQEFLTAMRTGKIPEGRYLSPSMPYKEYGKMVDQDLLAIFAYLTSLPVK